MVEQEGVKIVVASIENGRLRMPHGNKVTVRLIDEQGNEVTTQPNYKNLSARLKAVAFIPPTERNDPDEIRFTLELQDLEELKEDDEDEELRGSESE